MEGFLEFDNIAWIEPGLGDFIDAVTVLAADVFVFDKVVISVCTELVVFRFDMVGIVCTELVVFVFDKVVISVCTELVVVGVVETVWFETKDSLLVFGKGVFVSTFGTGILISLLADITTSFLIFFFPFAL